MLDYKDYFILNLLIRSYQPLTVDDLASLMKVSRRKVYYSINHINDYFETLGIDKIHSDRDLGILLDNESKSKLTSELYNTLTDTYVHTQVERIYIMLILIILKQKSLGIIDFQEVFSVSRNTVLNDIKELRDFIHTYHITLEYTQEEGYILEGTSLRIRSLILHIITSKNYLFKINTFDIYDESTYQIILTFLENVENRLQVNYVMQTKTLLAKMFAIVHKHKLPMIKFSKEDEDFIKSSDEYMAVKKSFGHLFEEKEWLYISLHLMGLRVHFYHTLITKDDDYVSDIVRFMIEEFKKFTLIQIEDEDTLFNRLYLHMKTTVIRSKYGIIIENELKNDIKEKYPEFYSIASRICKKLEEIINYPISEDDIAYVAMHFGGHLKRENKTLKAKKILLVCLNGVSASNILKKELETLLSPENIIEAVSLDEVDYYADQVDYILTTIPLEKAGYEHKIVSISPILTTLDKEKLKSILNPNSTLFKADAFQREVLSTLKEQLSKKDYEFVKKEIKSKLHKYFMHKYHNEGDDQKVLKELLKENYIMFKSSCKDYQEAIHSSAKPLVEENYITEGYVNKVIQNLQEMGPYIVVAPLIAISHARPEDGVNELCLSMLVLDEAVNFSDKDDRLVKVIITLGAPDESSHLKALGQLSEMLMNESDTIINASKKDDILTLVEQYSK